jgi:hypothetical protein
MPRGAEPITTARAASIVGVCTKTMRSYALRNLVPGAHQLPTGTWRFDESRLRRWVRERETTGCQATTNRTAATSSSAAGSTMPDARLEAATYDEAYERLLGGKR